MLQLKNTTPFKAAMAIFPDENGVDTLYVVVKGTFGLGRPLALADKQVPPTMADEYWGEPGASSLKYASEMHLCKPSTDVALVGNAWAIKPSKVPQLDVLLSVAERKKELRLFGNRRWKPGAGAMTPPEPFESMPLVYERAYGGVHVVDPDKPEVLAEERNPVGVGFLGKRNPKEMEGQPLPNIEDLRGLIKSPADPVSPAGFGFIPPSWLPRRSFAGTYDEAWQKGRAPYLPQDFNLRFFNAAHPDMVFDRYLRGGEPVEVVNASRKGPIRFELPVRDFDIKVRIAGSTQDAPANLETVLIEPDDDRVCLSWRALVPCDKKALKIEEIAIEMLGSKRPGSGA